MKYEPSSEVRHAAAMQLMERVDRLMKAERVVEHVPVAGDPPPGRSFLAEQRAAEEFDVLAPSLLWAGTLAMLTAWSKEICSAEPN